MFLIGKQAVTPAKLLMLVLAALLAVSVLKDAALLVLGKDLELQSIAALLTLTSKDDSWAPMYDAVEFDRGSGQGLYETIFFQLHQKFQYPPTSLLPFAALQGVGIDRAAGYALMPVVNFVAIAGLIAVIAMMWLKLRAPLPEGRLFPKIDRRWTALPGAAIVTLTFYPVMYGVYLGQIQVLIDFAIALALLFWIGGRPFAAGALVAVAALIKPQFGLLLVWALFRREWRFALGVLAVGVPFGLISLAVYGIHEHFEYLRVLSFIGQYGEYYWANQSMNGLLHRLLGADVGPEPEHGFAPYSPIVYYGTLISSAALLLFAMFWRPRRPGAAQSAEAAKRDRLLDFSMMTMVLVMASPVAWEHHYGVTLPIYVIAFALLLNGLHDGFGRMQQVLMAALGVSFFLVSNYLLSFDFLRGHPPFNIVQSYFFIGGLMLLGVLTAMRMTPGAQTSAKPA